LVRLQRGDIYASGMSKPIYLTTLLQLHIV
jgi:hypothetical protein